MPWSSASFQHPSVAHPIPVQDILSSSWILPLVKWFLSQHFISKMLWRLIIKPIIWLVEICFKAFSVAIPVTHHRMDITYKGMILRQTLQWMSRSRSPTVHYTWWTCYYYLSDKNDFECDYREAWSHFGWKHVHIFLETDHLYVPVPNDTDDAQTLRSLRMWFRWAPSRTSFLPFARKSDSEC